MHFSLGGFLYPCILYSTVFSVFVLWQIRILEQLGRKYSSAYMI
jgi:hypothetical protein